MKIPQNLLLPFEDPALAGPAIAPAPAPRPARARPGPKPKPKPHPARELTPRPPLPVLLSADEVAELLGVSKRTIWRLIESGQLPEPAWRANRKLVRWTRSQVETWLAARGQT